MKHLFLSAAIAALTLSACSSGSASSQSSKTVDAIAAMPTSGPQAAFVRPDAVPAGQATAIFAGGCFWCMEKDFEKLPGVSEAISGYTGGTADNPNYKQVSYTETGHYEAVMVLYDPNVVSYGELLDHYWVNVDPEDPNGQFCDKGSSYRTAIFATPEQIGEAKASKDAIVKSGKVERVVTPVEMATTFYLAEDYHQDFYKKSPVRYKSYRFGCGRDARLKELWGSK